LIVSACLDTESSNKTQVLMFELGTKT
jgi:hypothetical protein